MDESQLEAIRRLLAIADAYRLRELCVEENGLSVTIRGDAPPAPAASTAAAPEPEPHELVAELADLEDLETEADEVEESRYHQLRSPMTGIFYRAPSPDSPPFVVEGQFVEEGQTVGMIEAMKVFSEIPADASGRVVRILAETGRLFQQGEVLLEIDTAAE